MLCSNLLQNRRGLTTAVGTIFFVVIATSIVGYVTYSTNVISIISESVQIKQTINYERNTEEFEVVKVSTVNNKFNFTLQNTGNIPVNVTRLWVQNTTDSTWPSSKFNINTAIAPGATITNVGQNIDLVSLSTQSYLMKLVTERGSSQILILNSVGEESLYLKLHAAPTVVATDFTTTLILEVINTGTSQLLNLQAEMDSVTPSCGITCATLVSGPDPATFSSLDLGDVATFEWVYSLTGDNLDQFTFTASLVNGIDTDSTTVSVQAVQFAENSDVSLTTAGLVVPSIDDSILVFHQETFSVPASTPPNITYQMYSATPDGGVDGTLVQLDTVLLSSFYTKNGTDTITIPAGKWNASLYLQSEALPSSLNPNTAYSNMTFHFEDGQGVNPDNSESDATRDLQPGAGSASLIIVEETVNGSDEGNPSFSQVTTSTSITGVTNHLYLASVSVKGNNDITSVTGLGLTWAQVVEQCSGRAQTRTEIWQAMGTASTGTVTATRSSSSSNGMVISVSRLSNVDTADPIGATGSSNTVGQSGACSGGTDSLSYSTDITTTINDSMVWGAVGIRQRAHTPGTGYAEIDEIKSGNSGSTAGVATENKIQTIAGATTVTGTIGTSTDYSSVAVEIKPNVVPPCNPDWQSGQGPHGSGVYYFDGISCAFSSQNIVSSSDGNNLAAEPDTTSLWFKTDGAVSSEQHLVYWEGSTDYYQISLSNTGKVLFEFNTGGSDTTRCESTSGYDDLTWYHVTAVREGPGADECNLYIHNLSGTTLESINQKNNYGSNSVDVDGRWHVATNKNENGNWFKGRIDDIIHWNDKALTSAEATALAKTNYGTGAHQLDVWLDITDSSGTFVSNVFNATLTPISFQDSKNDPIDDNRFGIFNITMNLPQVIISPQQRLNFSMNFVPFTATWIPLELDMKIDDDTLSPFPSYLQMPKPDTPFPSYFSYDNDFEVDVFVTNSGNDGIYFVHSYTRINFNGTNGAYAGLIHSVNGTAPDFAVDSTKDSIYIPAGSKAELFFYIPTDQPSTTSAGTPIPPGIYRTAIWLHGYTDQGETFQKSIVLGSVNVVD